MLTIKKPRLARLVSTACAIAGLIVVSGCGDPGTRALLDGEQMINERRFSEAVDRLKLATHLLPDNPQAWNHRGLAHHGARQVAEALEAYRQALKLNENLAAARYNLGALLLESGDAQGAIQELGSFVVLRPTSVEGHVRLGSAQIRANQWEDAAKTYTQAFQMSDSNPEILNALGVIHLHRGEKEKAMPFFDRAVELNANYAPAKLNKAIYEHRYGNDKRQALDAYHKFALEHPNAPQAEEVMILAATLDRELNPRPVATTAGESTGQARKLEFAQLTDRATSASETAQSGIEASESRTEDADGAASVLEPAMTFKPLTDRAEGTGATAPEVTPASATELAAATGGAAAPTAPQEPVAPTVSEESFPRVEKPAPPADRQPEPDSKVETAAKDAREPEKTEVVVVEEKRKPTTAALTVDRTVAPPAEEVVVKPEQPKNAEPAEPPKVVPDKPAPAAEVAVAVEETATTLTNRPAPRIIESPPTVASRPVPEADRTPPPRSYVPTYHPEREEKEERGFLKRLDPRRFFKSREDRRKTTPLPGADAASRRDASPTEATATVVERTSPPPRPEPTPAPAPKVQASAPAPVRAEPPRYAYLNPPKPKAGDRRAAAPVFLAGLKAHEENRLSEAIKAYKDAAKLDGSLYEAHYNRGLASYSANQLAESLAAYETALAVKPDSSSARFNFAQALLKARYTRDSANELEKLIAVEPTQVAARLAAGNLYAKELGETRRARAHYLKVLELEPNHRQAQAIRYWLSQNR